VDAGIPLHRLKLNEKVEIAVRGIEVFSQGRAKYLKAFDTKACTNFCDCFALVLKQGTRLRHSCDFIPNATAPWRRVGDTESGRFRKMERAMNAVLFGA